MALCGAVGLTTISWLKYFAVVSHDFALILVMQSFCAVSHIFLSAIPAKILSWFPKNEECIISGVNIFCNNCGIVLNFISLMAINNSSVESIAKDLENFMFLVGVLSTIVSIAIAIFFKINESPELPPSYYEALKRDKIIHDKRESFVKALKILLTNKSFVMLTIGFGLQLGTFNGFSTLLNSIILHYFRVFCLLNFSLIITHNFCSQSGIEQAGKICFIISVLSVVGLFGFAYILDKYKNYNASSIWILRVQSIAFILFSLSLESQSFTVMCISSVLIG